MFLSGNGKGVEKNPSSCQESKAESLGEQPWGNAEGAPFQVRTQEQASLRCNGFI